MLKMIESRIEDFIWRKAKEILDSGKFKALVQYKVAEQSGAMRQEVERILESEEFTELVASKAAEYADIVRLRVVEGDVVIVPENTGLEELGNVASMFDDVRIAGVVAANLDDIGVIRTRHGED